MNTPLHYRIVEHGIELRIRLTPKSSRDHISTLVDSPDGVALQVFVRALPADGQANAALIALVAKWLRIPKSSISLRTGAKSRTKVLLLQGDTQALQIKVDALLGDKT